MGVNEKAVVLLSGGLDSSVLAYQVAAFGTGVHALAIDYGQRHNREIGAARAVTFALADAHPNRGVWWQWVDASMLGSVLTGSALTDAIAVPEGHYTDESMRATVVPNRNMILLAIAGGVAVANGASLVYTAVHAGDHAIYPDCRRPFTQAMDLALQYATEGYGDVHVVAPFVHHTKADIVRLGAALAVPFAATWSCYQGGEVHCGRCATCCERIWAFHEAAVDDPTAYDPDGYEAAVASLKARGEWS